MVFEHIQQIAGQICSETVKNAMFRLLLDECSAKKKKKWTIVSTPNEIRDWFEQELRRKQYSEVRTVRSSVPGRLVTRPYLFEPNRIQNNFRVLWRSLHISVKFSFQNIDADATWWLKNLTWPTCQHIDLRVPQYHNCMTLSPKYMWTVRPYSRWFSYPRCSLVLLFHRGKRRVEDTCDFLAVIAGTVHE